MATFNRAAAKADGFTDQEIDEYLSANPMGPVMSASDKLAEEVKTVGLQRNKIALQEDIKAATAAKTPYVPGQKPAVNRPPLGTMAFKTDTTTAAPVDKPASRPVADEISDIEALRQQDYLAYPEKISEIDKYYNSKLKQLDPTGSRAVREKEVSKLQASGVSQMSVDQMEDLFLDAGGGGERDPGLMGVAKEWGLGAAGALKLNERAGAYNNKRSGLIATLKGITGDTGVMTKDDANRIVGLLPTLGDSNEASARKFQEIRDLIASKYAQKAGATKIPVTPSSQKVNPTSLPDIQTGFGPDKSEDATSYLQQGMDIAKQAKLEKDPVKKASLLEKSRTLSGVGGDMNRETKINPIVNAGAKTQKFLAESDTLPIAGSIASNVIAPVLPVINTAFGAGVGEEAKGLLRRGGKEAFLPSIEEKEEQKGRTNKKIAEYVIADLLFKGAGKALPKIGSAIMPNKGVDIAKNELGKVATQLTEKTFSGDKIINAAKEYAKKDPYARAVVEEYLPILSGKDLTSKELLEHLPIWNKAYSAAGKVGDSGKKAAYNVFSQTARKMMKEEAPELFKAYSKFAGTIAWKSAMDKIFNPVNIARGAALATVAGGASAVGSKLLGGYNSNR